MCKTSTVALALLCMLLSGCLRRGLMEGHEITPKFTAFIEPAKTTREDVVGNFGPPQWEDSTNRTLAYIWTKGISESSEEYNPGWLERGGRGMFVRRTKIRFAQYWAYCVRFDESNRVARCGYLSEKSEQARRDAFGRF